MKFQYKKDSVAQFGRISKSRSMISYKKQQNLSSQIGLKRREQISQFLHLTIAKNTFQIISSIKQKLKKAEQFYDILTEQISQQNASKLNQFDYLNTFIRCFKHSSEVILYCLQDHQILCSNCVYGQQKNENNRLKTKPKDIHLNHKLKQVKNSNKEIANDLKLWRSLLNKQASDLKDIQLKWEEFYQKMQNSKNSKIEELNRAHDEKQKELSNRYLIAKQNILRQALNNRLLVETILQNFKEARNILISERFCYPLIKHLFYSTILRQIKSHLKNQTIKNSSKTLARPYQLTLQHQSLIVAFQKYARRQIKMLRQEQK